MSKVIIKKAILSYPKLDKPEAFRDGEPAYQATFVITDKEDLKALKKAVAEVGKEKWGDKFAAGLRSGKIRSPFKQADEDTPGYPEGSTYIRTRRKESFGAPGLVSVVPGPDGKPQRLEASRFYPGCIVNASVVAGAYGAPKSGIPNGVTFYLGNIQFAADGERLDNQVAAEDEFEADENAAADLSDMDEDSDAGSDDGDDEEEEDDLSDLM